MQSLARSAEPLAPGRYHEPGFSPRLSFEIRTPGAWVARQFVEGFFDIQQDPDSLDVIAVQFCRPSGVYTSNTGALAVTTPGEAIEALRLNADLAVNGVLSTAIAGRPALYIDIDTTTPHDSDPPIFSPVLRVHAGPISLASARRLRAYWLDLPDGPLAILVGGSITQWQRTLAEAEPILVSLRFEAHAQVGAAAQGLA